MCIYVCNDSCYLNSQERKLKSIEEIRRKRKRYRANKKKIFNSWKKKSEQYQQSVISEQIEHKEELKRQDEKKSFRAERKRLENDRRKKRKAIIENVYWSVACNSINEETEPLLLPACNSSTETSILPCSEPSNAEMSSPFKRIDTAVYIKKLKKEREAAFQDARIYRNLAERIRKEKREAINQLALKCEVIRDRWRNELLEGGSRGGLMVKKALHAKTII